MLVLVTTTTVCTRAVLCVPGGRNEHYKNALTPYLLCLVPPPISVAFSAYVLIHTAADYTKIQLPADIVVPHPASIKMPSDEKLGTLRYEETPTYTTSNGCPIMDPEASLRVGQNGPLLLQDFHLIDLLAHFDRERIPERVVHAKGAGAYGEFEVTHDVTDLVYHVEELSCYPH